MEHTNRRDGKASSLLTTSPMVQRFVLGVAVVLAGYHAVGVLQSRTDAHTHRRDHPPPVSTDAERPLLAIDLNRASAEELALLPGIGPVAATAIVESRHVDGPFLAVVDLERVHGVGPKTVQAVRPYLLPLPKGTEQLASANR